MILKSSSTIAFLLFLMLGFQPGCKKTPKDKTIVEFHVPSDAYDSIAFYLAKEKMTAYPSWGFEKAYFDSTGFLKLEIITKDIGWFFISLFPNKYDNEIKSKSRVFMLIRPGESYRIVFDSTYQWLFRISGNYEKAQNLYNIFNHNQGRSFKAWKTNTETLHEVLLNNLEDSINFTVQPFKELFLNSKIDSTYFRTVYNHIKYDQANAFLECISQGFLLNENPNQSKHYPGVISLKITKDEVQKLEKDVFFRYPISKNEAGIYAELGRYIDKYLKYKIEVDSLKIRKEGRYLEKLDMVDLASSYIENDLVEMYFAYQFRSSPMNPGPDSLATFLFKEFKKRYPESAFMPGVVRNIENLTGYYSAFYPGLNDSKSNLESTPRSNLAILSPRVKIIQDNDNITSLDSLLLQFRGQNLFVDFWASWCPPCRYEFRFADSLHQFLESHNIKMLYISTDEDEDKWKNALFNYDLQGFHFRASNPELRKDLRKVLDFLPTYMIIDSIGNIVVSDAEKPHTKTKLYNQIIESLN